jgi:hypothetical protein
MSPVLFETVVTFASVGVLFLVLAAWLLKGRMRATEMRVAAIRGGSHILLSGGIWTPKVIAGLPAGCAIPVRMLVKHSRACHCQSLRILSPRRAFRR